METEGVTAENPLVLEVLAAGNELLRDRASAADRAVVTEAYRAGTARRRDDLRRGRVLGDACDEVVVLGTECGKSVGDGLTAEQLQAAEKSLGRRAEAMYPPVCQLAERPAAMKKTDSAFLV